jgi:hypothetical protein
MTRTPPRKLTALRGRPTSDMLDLVASFSGPITTIKMGASAGRERLRQQRQLKELARKQRHAEALELQRAERCDELIPENNGRPLFLQTKQQSRGVTK